MRLKGETRRAILAPSIRTLGRTCRTAAATTAKAKRLDYARKPGRRAAARESPAGVRPRAKARPACGRARKPGRRAAARESPAGVWRLGTACLGSPVRIAQVECVCAGGRALACLRFSDDARDQAARVAADPDLRQMHCMTSHTLARCINARASLASLDRDKASASGREDLEWLSRTRKADLRQVVEHLAGAPFLLR